MEGRKEEQGRCAMCAWKCKVSTSTLCCLYALIVMVATTLYREMEGCLRGKKEVGTGTAQRAPGTKMHTRGLRLVELETH